MEEKRVHTTEGDITYLVHGKGPNLLFLHGGFATPRGYIPFIELLGQHFTVIAPTHPGHGDSFKLPEQWKFEDFGKIYAHFLKALGLGPMPIVAHSLGGAIGLELAAMGLATSIVAFDAMGLPITTTRAQYLSTLGREGRLMLRGIKKRQQLKEMLTAAGSILYSTVKHLESAKWLAIHGPTIDLHKLFRKISIPIYFLWGKGDQIVPSVIGEMMKQGITGSSLVIFPGKGHTYIATDPLFAYKEAMKFLKKLL